MSLPTTPGAASEPRAQKPDLRTGTDAPPGPDTLAFGPFTFDTRSRLLSRNGDELALPPRVIGVLELLLARAGEAVPRQDLIETVWKDAFVTDTSLAEAISVLRQALGDEPQSPTYIQTLHRRGYRFVAPVEPRGSAGHPGGRLSLDAGVRVSPSIGNELVPWSAAAILFVIAIAAVWQATRGREVIPSAARFTIAPAAGTAVDATAPAVALSDDGEQIAWSGCDAGGCRLYLRPVNDLSATPLAGTEAAHTPFFSPDGRWIAFFADGRLKKIATAGGAPITLADAPAMLGGVWHGREIIFAGAASGGLMRASRQRRRAAALTTPRERDGEIRHAWPAMVPGTSASCCSPSRSAAPDAPPGILAALSLDVDGGPRRASGGRSARASTWRVPLDGRDRLRARRRAARARVRCRPARSRGCTTHRASRDGARSRALRAVAIRHARLRDAAGRGS